ncbi:MAG: DUF421 domain-containing protein [Ignavibacteria bacterium]|nr:DUF421 domain-containing protein [Ignavibacteria bacterium]
MIEILLITALKCIAIYFLVLLCLRILGKRSLAEISPIDLVFILLIGSVLGQQLPEENKFISALVSIIALAAVNYLLTRGIYKHKALRKIIEGEPVILIRNGKLYKNHMEREKITQEHLVEAARHKGVKELEDVELAILETDGKISIIKLN